MNNGENGGAEICTVEKLGLVNRLFEGIGRHTRIFFEGVVEGSR